MVTADDLRQIYCPEHIHEGEGSLTVKEKQNAPERLAEVTFSFDGHIIHINQDLLEKTKDCYRKNTKCIMEMTRICDGALILDGKDGRHFVVYIELKSGFNDVKRKAIKQIPPSYMKINSCLNDFDSFVKKEYHEFALIVSYPPCYRHTESSDVNPIIMANKKAFTGDRKDMVCEKYFMKLRNKGCTVFEGRDFGMDTFQNIKGNLLFERLAVKHHSVEDKCEKAYVNLDVVIDSLFGSGYKE